MVKLVIIWEFTKINSLIFTYLRGIICSYAIGY